MPDPMTSLPAIRDRLVVGLIGIHARIHLGPITGPATGSATGSAEGEEDDAGQTTAEYVLLILGAATIAILVTSWASATDKVSRLFDRVINSITNKVG